MPSTQYRRRRVSRLAVVVLVVVLAVAAVAGLVLVGAISRVGRESGPYWRDVDRSCAVQANGIVRRSNAVASRYRSVVSGMSSDSRERLEVSLDSLVDESATLAREAARLATPPTTDGACQDVARAMADRATSVADLRGTVDGLLDMTPLIDRAAGSSTTTSGPGPRTLSAAAAARRIERVSALLATADRLYAAGRRALARGPGTARIPQSAWLRRTVAWTSGTAASVVADLVDSTTLVAAADVVLVPHALVLTPGAVPPTQGSDAVGTLRLPPTKRLSLTALLADEGNESVPGVVVDESLKPTRGVATDKKSARVVVPAGDTVSVSLPSLHVRPAGHYTLTVRVESSKGDPAGPGTTETLSIAIAPPAPATVVQLEPTHGRPRGGTVVTILGAGFTSVHAVDFGRTAAHFSVVSKSQIDAVAPPGAGSVTVILENPGGASVGSSDSRFTYERPKHVGSS